MGRRLLYLIWMTTLLHLGGGCAEPERPSSRPPQASAPPTARAGRVLMMADLGGYLEPCGCQSTSLGGIDKAATLLRQRRSATPAPLLVVAGELLFEDGDDHQRSDEDARAQELWKSEALVEVLAKLQVDAGLFGQGDLRYGQPEFAAAMAHATFPWFGADKTPPGTVVPMLKSSGGLRVGLLMTELPADIASTKTSLMLEQQKLREQGADVVLAVVNGDYRGVRQLAASVEGLDFLLAAGRDHDEPSPPEKLGATFLLTAGRHGRGVLDLELRVSSPGAQFVDVSPWTREAQRHATQAAIDDLEARIRGWKADPNVDKALVAEQEARLRRLRKDLSASDVPTSANTFEATYLPITQDIAGEPTIKAQMASYDARVNEHNRTAFADRKPRPVAAGEAGYVGSATCKGCHADAFAWWQGHPHGHAYDTLVTRNKQYNLSCVGCHVTGYDRPGGSTVTHNAGLIHVGCESCHGPGSLHMGDKSKIVRSPTESTCVQCHNAEHSDQFDFAAYRARLIVKGHGLPALPGPADTLPVQ